MKFKIFILIKIGQGELLINIILLLFLIFKIF